MTNDMVNGLFELVGAAMLSINVYRLWKDKAVMGVSPLTTLFFTSWGLFNLYFYPANGLMWSYYGGLAIVTVNSVWLCMLAYYTWRLKP